MTRGWLPMVFLTVFGFIVAACTPAATTTPPSEDASHAVTTSAVANDMPATPAPLSTPTLAPTAQPVIQAWWNDVVFYEVFVRSFQDSNGDGIGDLNGLISRLDYLQSLGVTGLWLMPVADSPSYHGYDVTDYALINPDYGTNEDFKRLMEEAHARNMVVIVDHVINHTSSEHPWFIESQTPDAPRRDWYVWADTPPTFNAWHVRESGAYYGFFWEGMPDLNYRNPEVTAAIYEATRFWLEDMGVDGLRMDAIKYLIETDSMIENTAETHEWLRDFHTYYKSINPNALTVGEIWSSSTIVREYVPDQMDIAFEFDLADATVRSAQSGRKADVERTILRTFEAFPVNQYATFLTNHDQNRVRSRLLNDEQARTAATMLLTHPGVPFLYYGEEIGMQGTKPDENIRRPMQWNGDAGGGFTTAAPWHPFFDDASTRHVAAQEGDPTSLLNHYRALLSLRNSHSALRTGEYLSVTTDNNSLYAFIRRDESATLLVLVNLGKEPLTTYTLSLPAGLASVSSIALLLGEGTATAPTLDGNGGFSAYQPLPELAGTGSYVIQLQ